MRRSQTVFWLTNQQKPRPTEVEEPELDYPSWVPQVVPGPIYGHRKPLLGSSSFSPRRAVAQRGVATALSGRDGGAAAGRVRPESERGWSGKEVDRLMG